MSAITWIAVALAGAIGAPFRYIVEKFVQPRISSSFPSGIFAVNMSGALIFGFFSGLAIYHGFPNAPKVVLTSGFCGAYTTFSTFAYESVRLSNSGQTRIATAYVLSSIVLGWALAGLGMAIASITL